MKPLRNRCFKAFSFFPKAKVIKKVITICSKHLKKEEILHKCVSYDTKKTYFAKNLIILNDILKIKIKRNALAD